MFSTLEHPPIKTASLDEEDISNLAKLVADLAKFDIEDKRDKPPAPPADKGHQA